MTTCFRSVLYTSIVGCQEFFVACCDKSTGPVKLNTSTISFPSLSKRIMSTGTLMLSSIGIAHIDIPLPARNGLPSASGFVLTTFTWTARLPHMNACSGCIFTRSDRSGAILRAANAASRASAGVIAEWFALNRSMLTFQIPSS